MAYTTIDDPRLYFQNTLWTGTGGAKTITGLSHKPDLIWTKTRTKTYNHMLSDSTRGFNANSEIATNGTAVEGGLDANVYGYKSGHTADGWTMVDGTDTQDSQEDGNTNEPNVKYVGWTWPANGGTTTSFAESGNNPGGTYQANSTGKFSIVRYIGTGAIGTVQHGLGAKPDWIMIKRLESADNMSIYHSTLTGTHRLRINLTSAQQDTDSIFNDTEPTSSVFTLKTNNEVNGDGEPYVAYCWSAVQGYSKFGSYEGNGDADGPVVYTGFTPAWLMLKVYNGNTGGWDMYDSARAADVIFNNNEEMLQANASALETSNDAVQFLSNGFKIRNTTGNQNGDGNSHAYFAFAKHPLVSSLGVPATVF